MEKAFMLAVFMKIVQLVRETQNGRLVLKVGHLSYRNVEKRWAIISIHKSRTFLIIL